MHIVPHSHDGEYKFCTEISRIYYVIIKYYTNIFLDVGWLKTVEQYYYGGMTLFLFVL